VAPRVLERQALVLVLRVLERQALVLDRQRIHRGVVDEGEGIVGFAIGCDRFAAWSGTCALSRYRRSLRFDHTAL